MSLSSLLTLFIVFITRRSTFTYKTYVILALLSLLLWCFCTWQDFHVTHINLISLNTSSKLFLSMMYRVLSALRVKKIQNSISLSVLLCTFVICFILYIGYRTLWGRQSLKYSIYSVFLKYPAKWHIWYCNSKNNFVRLCRILIGWKSVKLGKKERFFSATVLDYHNIAVHVQYLVDSYKKSLVFFSL